MIHVHPQHCQSLNSPDCEITRHETCHSSVIKTEDKFLPKITTTSISHSISYNYPAISLYLKTRNLPLCEVIPRRRFNYHSQQFSVQQIPVPPSFEILKQSTNSRFISPSKTLFQICSIFQESISKFQSRGH